MTMTWSDYVTNIPRAVVNPTVGGFKRCFFKPLTTLAQWAERYNIMPASLAFANADLKRVGAVFNGMAVFSSAADFYNGRSNWVAVSYDAWECFNYLRDVKIVTPSDRLGKAADWV